MAQTSSRNSRARAADVLARVLSGKGSLSDALAPALAQTASPADRAFLQALAYTTLRQGPRLEFLLTQLVHRPIKDAYVHALALLGLGQLAFMAVKPHAAVAETVAAGEPWARPLLNAILRGYQRRRAELDTLAEQDPVATTAHPAWIIQRVRDAWPEEADALFHAANQPPPMTLRVHSGKTDRSHYLATLAAAGIKATPHPDLPDALTLEVPRDVQALPGFAEGLVSVQDAAAQWAATLLDAQAGDRALDACAAPGGKAAHLLEREPGLALTALDHDAQRAERIRETFQRLGLVADVRVADAGEPSGWWDGAPFQRIVLDAPCSGSGVIRRHPDIKALRRPSDLLALTTTQNRLLEALWPLLAEGGVLLYATCSIFPEENAGQIRAFLARHPDAVEWPMALCCGRGTAPGWQILTGESGMDGFYYARVRKQGKAR